MLRMSERDMSDMTSPLGAATAHFRECVRLLTTLEANLAALANITSQKVVLEGAVRRRQRCAYEDGCSSVCSAPLGVLTTFTSALTDHLLAQHQNDQTQLLQSVSQVQQSWSHKMERVRALVAEFELSCHLAAVDDDGDCRDASAPCLVRRTGGASPQKTEPSVTRTGLGVSSAISTLSALHGLLGALHKMNCTIQEWLLAARSDVLRNVLLQGPATDTYAPALSRFYAGEESDGCDSEEALMALARVGIVRQGDTSVYVASRKCGQQSCTALEVVSSLQATLTPLSRQLAHASLHLTLVDAFDRAGPFMHTLWQRCKSSHFTDETWLLVE